MFFKRYRHLLKDRTIYFTLPHNNPSGGVKVVNEFVLSLRSKNIKSFLCLPKQKLSAATFLESAAPILSLDEMVQKSEPTDIIIVSWQSKDEIDAVRRSKAYKKVFWQHGILIPIGPEVVGEKVYEIGCFDLFWNVSHICADYIKAKYNLPSMDVVNPFFNKQILNQNKMLQRHGCIVLERRGALIIPQLKKFLKTKNESLTVLCPPYQNIHFRQLLKCHKLFISIDNGLNQLNWFNLKSIFKKKKWIKHDQNYCGFPMPPIEAALSGCLVAGYRMGGGTEWMNTTNSFIAEDNNEQDLLNAVDAALKLNESAVSDVTTNAMLSVSKFTPENSIDQMMASLFGELCMYGPFGRK